MTALLPAVFVASVLGSLHCVGMCGPLIACAVAVPGQDQVQLGRGFGVTRRRSAWWSAVMPQASYHGGRLLGYAVLGLAAGSAGALVDLGSTLSGLQPVAAVLAGCVIVVIGVATLSNATGWTRLPRLPRWWTVTAGRAQVVALRFPPVPRALTIGLLTPLLPCGWLYAFAITAAGTGSALMGAAVMAVFWLGTLPILVVLLTGLRHLIGRAGRRVTMATALVMVVIGLFMITGRMSLDPVALAQSANHADHAQHDPQATDATATVPDAGTTPPCCAHPATAAEGQHDH